MKLENRKIPDNAQNRTVYNDHREINKKLDLYHVQEDAPGMIFWHNNGWIIFQELKNFIRDKLKFYKYKEVKTPIITDLVLWEKTGHWSNYSKNMFFFKSEKKKYCIKPMNCPGHIQIFNQHIHSYKDLPIRISEFGICHRNEPSGSLHGLMRLKSFTQDDAHIFCTNEQISHEVNHCIKIIFDVYNTFGFEKFLVNLSTRPKNSIGNENLWNKAEKDLVEVLKNNNIDFKFQHGKGAFYGPKIEFNFIDHFDRYWQCGTIQLDFYLPDLLDSFYVTRNNIKAKPILIHRAILGSIERFIGIITEQFLGRYPTWLAPIQVAILNINKNQLNYVLNLEKKFLKFGIRIYLNIENDNLNSKIRKCSLKKIPYILICGNQEVLSNTVTVRSYRDKDLKIFNVCVDKFIENIKNEISTRSLKKMEK